MKDPVEIVDRDTVPDSGFWRRGNMVINNAFAAGEPLYWICTVSGEPGTWKAVYVTSGDMLGYSAVPSTIDADRTATVPSGMQQVVFGTLTVNGVLTIEGELRVCAWPA